MRARIESLSPRARAIAAAAAVLLYAAVIWLLLVSPKRADAADARTEVATAEIRLAEARATSNRPGATAARITDLFRLAKAMPATADQAGLLLELNMLARSAGLKVRVIAPKDPIAVQGEPTVIPISVTVGGSYFQISRFVHRIQSLVKIRNGRIHAKGRLFMVQSLGLVESPTEGFPELDAIIVLHAYVYDGPIVPVDVPDAPADAPEPTGTSAAGSTS